MTMMRRLLAALVLFQTGTIQPADSALQADVDRLVLAAAQLKEVWPSQAPPPIPEVALVARYGRRVTPLLVALLSDDPNVQSDDKRWKVQQQVSLVLSQIYSESPHCGRAYCDGDPPERISQVKAGWLRVIASDAEMRALSSRELLDRFKKEPVFWRQFEIGDRRAVAPLITQLDHNDATARVLAIDALERLNAREALPKLRELQSDDRRANFGNQLTVAAAAKHAIAVVSPER